MIAIATLNIQRAGAAKVDWLADAVWDDEMPIDVLAIQELDLHENSIPNFTERLRARAVHVFLGGCVDGLYRCAVLSKLPGVRLDLYSDRLAGVVFQLLTEGRLCNFVVASYYGCATDRASAMSGAEHAVQELKKCQSAWCLVGDFNLEATEEPLCSALAGGLAYSWDLPFEAEGLLPATRCSGRRIDFGLGCGQHFPVATAQRWTFSDHAQVVYEVDMQEPVGHRPPSFRPLTTEPVTDQRWAAVWDAETYEASLRADDLDAAWTLLSDSAEKCLAKADGHGHRRSQPWRPRVQLHQRSKAAKVLQPLLEVQLRRLSRRMWQLRRRPGDVHLRSKAGKQLCDLAARAPWLSDVPFFEAERWCEWLDQRIEEVAAATKHNAIERWRGRLDASETRLTAWIKRREKVWSACSRPLLQPEAVCRRTAVHPVAEVAQASEEWMQRWGSCSATGDLAGVLATRARLPVLSFDFEFTGEDLLRSAKSMLHKAEGPDQWSCASWVLLPAGFWSALARLWQRVLMTGVVPQRWREGRVVLIEKPTQGYRPLTILPIAWRIGARVLVKQLTSWVERWASWRVLGGVAHRGLKDSYLRLLESLSSPRFYLQEDLTKFFDSVRLPDLVAVLRHLGCPACVWQLVQSYYQEHRRVFSKDGVLGDQWHSVRRGLAQGCPLSPVLAAAVMAMWSSMVESGPSLALSSMSFVDDRLLWSNTVEELRRAKALSDQFDQAFDLSCDRKKSRLALCGPSVEASAFASELNYEECDALSVLGLTVPLDGSSGPSLKDFCLMTVKVRTRLIGIAARGLVKQARLLRTMVLPMLTWAGGFATIQHEEMEEIVAAFRDLLYSTLAHDTPLVLLYELAGWEIQPQFACELAALREAVRIHCREPSWMEEASVRFAARRWPDLLPTTVKVLTSLGWTWDPRGSYILRLDSYGQERRFVLGVDSFEVLTEWLRDVFRRRFLAKCGRVVHQLHRDAGDDVAQGFSLPGPPQDCLAVFAGHRWTWQRAKDTVGRRSALVTGCSYWHKCKKLPLEARPALRCLCGKSAPSRPHLMWCCPELAALRSGLALPGNRMEERLLAKEVQEIPAAPVVLSRDEFLEEMAAAMEARLGTGGPLVVATDGSTVASVAAWAAVLDGTGEGDFALGVPGEDQTSHRAEVEALVALLEALATTRSSGTVHVLVDCQAALRVVHGGGSLPLLARRAVELRAQLRGRLRLDFWWVPSHGKAAPAKWVVPPCGEAVARALNARADRVARDCATRRAAGSGRKQCASQREQAMVWEKHALQTLTAVARRWAEA